MLQEFQLSNRIGLFMTRKAIQGLPTGFWFVHVSDLFAISEKNELFHQCVLELLELLVGF